MGASPVPGGHYLPPAWLPGWPPAGALDAQYWTVEPASRHSSAPAGSPDPTNPPTHPPAAPQGRQQAPLPPGATFVTWA